MPPFMPAGIDPTLQAIFWSAATIALYLGARAIYRRWPRWWLMPLAIAPLALIMTALALHTSYRDYSRGTHWLVSLLGPVTVAFAVPIYEKRGLIRRHWRVLAAGMLLGSATSMLTAWGLARLLGLNETLTLSLLPRSMSTPFAMTVSSEIGGAPDLTAVFAIVTGIVGAAIGDVLLLRLPIRTSLALGALLGVAAHGAGTAKAHEIGQEEGAVAGLVMVLVGLLNVLLAPLLILARTLA